MPAKIMLGAMRIAFLLKTPGDADVMAAHTSWYPGMVGSGSGMEKQLGQPS